MPMSTLISDIPPGTRAGGEPATRSVAPKTLRDALIREAFALGFDAARITTPDAIKPAGDRLVEFLEHGRHGDMSWMETTADRRRDPRVLWPEVRSIIMLGASYAPERDPLEALGLPSNGAISVYAQGRDYHDIIKGKLKRLGEFLAREAPCDVRVFVDTAPLMEKPLAHAAGIGWQGKHTNLVSRSAGSWLFLGAVLTDLALEADAAEVDHCGSCRRCLDICPTDAFPRPYELDARRCIAYLTIEHKGHIAREFRRPIGNRIFGCDDCLAVCPWNKFASAAHEARFAARQELQSPTLSELLLLDDDAFRKRFAGTPIKRTGRDRFMRNVLIAAGNSRDIALLPQVMALLGDASALVRAMAVWALRELGDPATVAEAKDAYLAREADDGRAQRMACRAGRMSALFCFGLGYSAEALARRLAAAGYAVRGTSRSGERTTHGFETLLFDGTRPGAGVAQALSQSTHVLLSAAPGDAGDPALIHHGDDIERAESVRWIGYLSTIGVYGDAGGAWIDEETPARPGSARASRRIEAEAAWLDFGRRTGKRVQIFRLGGIYGPGRSALDDLRAGSARRIVKPGQVFNRIHVEDIANVLAAAVDGRGRHTLYNVVDDEPGPPQDVVAYAAGLLGVPPPPEIAFEKAELSPMGLSFYSENRRVRNTRLKEDLGVRLAYPSFREGLAAVLAAEQAIS